MSERIRALFLTCEQKKFYSTEVCIWSFPNVCIWQAAQHKVTNKKAQGKRF